MAKLSNHAKERLKTRFHFTEKDIANIGSIANDPNMYTIIRVSKKGEFREFIYDDIPIHAIVRGDCIVTFTQDLFVQDEEAIKDNAIRRLEHELEMAKATIANNRKRIEKIRTDSFFKSIKRFIAIRYGKANKI